MLGHSSVLGATEVRATTHVPVDPFRAAAHRFTVLLDLPRPRFQRLERGLQIALQPGRQHQPRGDQHCRDQEDEDPENSEGFQLGGPPQIGVDEILARVGQQN